MMKKYLAILLLLLFPLTVNASYIGSSPTVSYSDSANIDAAGAQRSLGTVSVLLTGVGGTSTASVELKFKEIR